MELDDLKTSWNALDKRLADTEIVNLRIVKEMISQKTKTAYERLMGLNLYTLIANLLVMALVFPYVLMNTPITFTTFVIVEAILLIGLTPHVRKLMLLSKFDLDDKKTNELTRLMLRYKQECSQEVYWTIGTIAFAFAGFFISELGFNASIYTFSNKIWLVIALVLLTFAIAFAIGFWHRRSHALQMKEIEQGLKELKEFEE